MPLVLWMLLSKTAYTELITGFAMQNDFRVYEDSHRVTRSALSAGSPVASALACTNSSAFAPFSSSCTMATSRWNDLLLLASAAAGRQACQPQAGREAHHCAAGE